METALAENSHLEIDACVAENSRLGFRAVFAGLHPAIDEVKPKNASGIGDELRREGVRSRSTGKERDAETGLDNFIARYLSSAEGRFTSSDPENIGADPSNPQTWNGYSYATDNPLSNTDPTGMFIAKPNDDDSWILLDLWWWHSLEQVRQTAYDMTNEAIRWFLASRDPNCVAGLSGAYSGLGAAAGGTAGAFGFSLGPVGVVSTPVGAAIGGSTGAVVGGGLGMISCMTSSGGSGGGEGVSRGGPGKQGKFWKSLKNFRQNIKTNGLRGSAKRFFTFDYTHGDIEVYDAQGLHLGSADPETGVMTKPAVPGRRITL
jgi:RHS repeat-associated protein